LDGHRVGNETCQTFKGSALQVFVNQLLARRRGGAFPIQLFKVTTLLRPWHTNQFIIGQGVVFCLGSTFHLHFLCRKLTKCVRYRSHVVGEEKPGKSVCNAFREAIALFSYSLR
jgi:hypothetical protein